MDYAYFLTMWVPSELVMNTGIKIEYSNYENSIIQFSKAHHTLFLMLPQGKHFLCKHQKPIS